MNFAPRHNALRAGKGRTMGVKRPLVKQDLAEAFVGGCIPKSFQFAGADGVPLLTSALATRVRDAELLFETGVQGSTMTDRGQRVGEWRSDDKREELRKRIVESLTQLNRLADDEAITLDSGGARPISDIQANSVAILLTGLPASGKSSVVSRIADAYGAYVIDPDYAKRKLPEYDGSMMGASVVHDESSALTLGKNYDGVSLLQFCISTGANIVRPMVGEDERNLEVFRNFLADSGYVVHLCTIDLPRADAVGRALGRFLNTGRYVSLSYIYDGCANDPALVYYRIRTEACRSGNSAWASLGAISTAGKSPVQIDSWHDSPAKLF
jgi:hypothetical protein